MEPTIQNSNNECVVCYGQKERFVVQCQNLNHRICEQCFVEIVDLSICCVCRQQNPIYQRIIQQQQIQDNVSQADSDEETEYNLPYMQMNFQQEQIHIRVLRPMTREIKNEINQVLESFIQPQRRSARIAQQQVINYQDFAQLGRNYRM